MRNHRKQPKQQPFLRLTLSLLTLLSLLLLLLYTSSPPHLSTFLLRTPPQQCPATHADKYLFYAPHSGFSNQLSELKNAVLFSSILNRTLIIPPVLDHHAVALGSCPKFRVLDPAELRIRVWDHSLDLIRQRRYISMADVIDLSSVSTMIRTIDFRDFVLLWCGVNLDVLCSDGLSTQSTSLNHLKQCRSTLSGLNGSVDKCLYAVDVDCRTTVWTYQNDDSNGSLDSFQPDEQLRRKRKFSYVRRRQDVYKHLGPASEAHSSSLLAFGSLFTAPYKGSQSYIDIRETPRDGQIQALIDETKFLPFVSVIRDAGKEYAQKKISEPFLCAQLRLLDGQFKNHWEATFSGLKQKVESAKQEGSLPVHIFVMTDLPRSNWSSSYLGDLMSDENSFKLHALSDGDEIVRRTVAKMGSGVSMKLRNCPRGSLDLLLYIEETVCSCASLGFVGTPGSTIAESIELMRNSKFCLG